MKSRLILLFAGCAYRVAASSRVEVDIANNREKPAAACAARNHFAKRQAAGAMLLLLAQLACNLDAAWLGTTLAEIPHGSAPVQPRTYSNGNRTNVVRRSYEYDLENRLIRVDDGQVRMVYDGDGHRVRKTVPTAGGGSTTTYYLVDDLNPTGYAQVLEEWEASDGKPPRLVRRFTHGLGLVSVRDSSESSPEPTTHYYGYDGHGSVRLLTGEAGGTITDTYTYDAYGVLIAQTPVDADARTPNSYLHAGEQWDSDLGLYYNRARYQDPNLGRFWTKDTFEGNRSDPLSLHKYLHAQGNPVNGVDPSGHEFSLAGLYYGMGARLFLAGSALTTAYPGAVRVAQSTVTALTVGSLAVSEDARLAFLATGNPSAAIAGLAGDVGLLVYRGGRLVQQTASSIARAGVMSKIEQPLGHVARRVKNIADDAIVGYRGSVASGVKHSTQGSFDPNDFDLDGFIVSDKLAARAPLRRFRDGGAIPDIGEEAKRIEELLKESFPGYRVNIETIHLPDLDSAGV